MWIYFIEPECINGVAYMKNILIVFLSVPNIICK